MRLIDAWKLCEYANNLKDKQVDANDIMRFPTVDAEPIRHGRWVKNDEYSDEIEGHIIYECSECGELYDWFDVPEHRYCRHCGAKMDLPEPIIYPQVEGITPTVVKMDEVTE